MNPTRLATKPQRAPKANKHELESLLSGCFSFSYETKESQKAGRISGKHVFPLTWQHFWQCICFHAYLCSRWAGVGGQSWASHILRIRHREHVTLSLSHRQEPWLIASPAGMPYKLGTTTSTQSYNNQTAVCQEQRGGDRERGAKVEENLQGPMVLLKLAHQKSNKIWKHLTCVCGHASVSHSKTRAIKKGEKKITLYMQFFYRNCLFRFWIKNAEIAHTFFRK